MATIERFIGPLGCGSTADMLSLFSSCTSNVLYTGTGGYANGKSILHSGSSVGYTLNCTAAKTKVVGFWISGSGFRDYNASAGYSLCYFTGPDIRIYNTSVGFDIRRGATNIATDSDYVSSDLTHVEIKVFSSATVGTVEIKINGVSVYSGTNLNTDGTDITSISLGTPISGATSSGIFIADDWVGPLIPKLLVPTSDQAVQLARSTGSDNYALVDETGEDGDTTYVQSNTAGEKDLYGFSDIPSGYTPKVLSVVIVAKESDAGGKSFKIISKQSSTTYTLATKALPAVYPASVTTGLFHTMNTLPDTAALTLSDVNALQFGVEVV